MGVVTSPKTYAALAAFHAVDAVACAIPLPVVAKTLDELGVPRSIRWVFPVVKGAAAVGLLSVRWFPAVARLTTAMLTLYFALAIGAHLRAGDSPVKAVPAASFLVTFAVMTLKGPQRAAT